MYFAIDADGTEFEGKTLLEVFNLVKNDGYIGCNEDYTEVSFFKGTKLKVKFIPESIIEVVEPKKVVRKSIKKPTSTRK